MNTRIPYETVVFEAEKIFIKALAEEGDVKDAYKKYVEYIQACGWTMEDFNAESLKKIDKDWESDPSSN